MKRPDLEGVDVPALFAAGAFTAGACSGMTEKEAEELAFNVCKEAAYGRRMRIVQDDEEDEDETFWDRNKWWLVPALVGTGAFLVGSNSGQVKRPDRGHFEGAWDFIKKRMKDLLGQSKFMEIFTKTPNKGKEFKFRSPDPVEPYQGDDKKLEWDGRNNMMVDDEEGLGA